MYLIFDTELEAIEYSHAKAIEMGFGKTGDICQYWYGWRETTNGKWAMQCPEGTEQEPEWREND